MIKYVNCALITVPSEFKLAPSASALLALRIDPNRPLAAIMSGAPTFTVVPEAKRGRETASAADSVPPLPPW
ncbi:MAG: hypothetical protein ACKPKO_63885, partial [Candidatus Fonsibacter sp.]